MSSHRFAFQISDQACDFARRSRAWQPRSRRSGNATLATSADHGSIDYQVYIVVIILFMQALVARRIHRVLAAPVLLVDPTPRVSYR